MMKICRSTLIVALGAVALLYSSCKKDDGGVQPPAGPGNQSNDRISITNDEAQLSSRVTYYNQNIPLDSLGIGFPKSTKSTAFSLTLVAEVRPPVICTDTLQATCITIKSNKALVSYNLRGAPYRGGIDVFDISTRSNPILKSQALFQNTDISAVINDGSDVYVAEATGDTGFVFPAVFEKMRLQGNNLILSGNGRLGVTSFAATGVGFSGTKVYVTSGNTGGLSVINPSTLTILNSISLHDARWVDIVSGKVVVVQGTPGQISVFNETNMALQGTFPFNGANIAESKSTVAIAGGKAFIAAGTGGVKVLSVFTGTQVGSVARPNPDSLGLDSSVVVTNAVSIDQDLLFVSNGEAGVYVAQGSQDFSSTGSETQQQITLLGRLRFGNLQSVNHVEYKGHYLIIASGLGGLKIVNVTF